VASRYCNMRVEILPHGKEFSEYGSDFGLILKALGN